MPAGLERDEQRGGSIDEAVAEAVGEPATTHQSTILETDDPLSSGVFEELKTGAELAAENGITQWAVVVDERIEGDGVREQARRPRYGKVRESNDGGGLVRQLLPSGRQDVTGRTVRDKWTLP